MEKYRKWIVAFCFSVGAYFVAKYIIPFFWPFIAKLGTILLPFILAVFFSLLLEPMVSFFRGRLKLKRGAATGLSMLAFFGGILLVFSLVVTRLVYEIIRLIGLLPSYKQDFIGTLDLLFNKGTTFWHQTNVLVQELDPQLQKQFTVSLQSLGGSIEAGISQVLKALLGAIQYVPGGISSLLTLIVIMLLATYFIISDRSAIKNFWIKLMPAPYGQKTITVTVEVANAFGKYLRAQIILLSITMIISIIGLTISGAQYALTVGLIIGFMDLVPVLGPGSIYVPWMIGSYYSGNPIFALKLLVLYVVVVLVRQVFETKVVSDSLGIHPLATLVSMYVGLQTIGIPGLFVGPVTVIGILALIKTGVFKLKI